jgi:chemotaxis protein CheZ
MQEKLIKPSVNDEDFQAMAEVVSRIQRFLDCIANGELNEAEEVLREIVHFGEQKPIAEIKRITDSLHNSLNEFKKLITPEVKNIVAEDMPEAQDKLQWVINKTEEAVSQTIKLVEKNLDIQSDIVKRLDIIDAALKRYDDITDEERQAMEFLRNALEGMNADLMELLLIQEYQDLTGQIIKKVIELTATLERELSNLIKLFGKTEPVKKEERIEKQDELDELLSEFGL